MSAWYVFGVMGFYPVTPADPTFALGAPQFDEVTLNLHKEGKPKSFRISAKNRSDRNFYIKSVRLDGKTLSTPFITYQQIMDGKNLEFEMTDRPNVKAFKNP